MVAGAGLAGGAVGRDRAGDLVLVDLVERGGLGKLARLAIGGRGGGAALLAAGEAAVDAVAVGVVGDDENLFLRLRGRCAEQRDKGDGGNKGSHGTPAVADPDRSCRTMRAKPLR